ncbi:MAG: hypothetical protein R3C13_07415 [Hyphomonas sp.]|uniref:hypothetical protein n=1 Tax=Hyphomonas sp. TaxID=87 RepID=UPI00352807A4
MKRPDTLPDTMLLLAKASFWLAGMALMFIWRLLISAIPDHHGVGRHGRTPGLLAATQRHDPA